MSVRYEWDVEVVLTGDEPEVVDHLFQTSYRGAVDEVAIPAEDGHVKYIVLVRDDDNGRSWAYMEDGKLPSRFEDAYGRGVAVVPKRFLDEVAKVTRV